jgi:DNA-binding MurR/RpiR family transcriptional regulator
VTNGKHRARWLAELVSDAQSYLARAREAPEAADVRRAIALLQDARRAALADVREGDES